ncbi:RidA family protein [Pseudorhodoferax sp.]|uniref:RidA family protein n=1 Tax=Pseudorhodoferax sp. TaxID=1993553 RepID=UPI002DD68A2B|nr:RidA family protein [Pseudorhodoferax sp.]
MSAGPAASRLPPALGAYPRTRRAGDWIYVSGLSARLADGSIDGVSRLPGRSVHRDAGVQTRRVLCHLAEVLQAAGARLADCVDITVFLTDRADFDVYNQVYAEHFAQDGPARTTVVVRGLPHADMVVEMKAVAWCGPRPGAQAGAAMEAGHAG